MVIVDYDLLRDISSSKEHRHIGNIYEDLRGLEEHMKYQYGLLHKQIVHH